MEKGATSQASSSNILKQENDVKSEKINDYFLTGGDGSVFKGLWKEREIAVQRVKISECTENWKDIVDSHLTESLNHDNVLKIVGYKEGSDQFRYFALELYAATLEQFCNGQYTGPMPTDAQVLCQIANGINYLHSKGLEHGNLNPQTILISQGQPVRMKVSDFGLRKCFDFRWNEDTVDVQKIRHLSIKDNPQPRSLSMDDNGASPRSSPLNVKANHGIQSETGEPRRKESATPCASLTLSKDATVDPDKIPRTLTFTARNKPNDSSSHPGIWMLAGSWSESKDQNGNVSIQVNPTVHGDVFSAGCLFFYFLTRGSHPFGEPAKILDNINARNPTNLNKLDPRHFAFKPIQNLICEPPTDGKQWLIIAAQTFQAVLPLKIDETKEIGRGGFGTVYPGTYGGKDVAVKKIPTKVAEENRTDFEREMELHKQLDHENVLKLLHVDEEKDPLSKYLVLELCSGTLSQFCDKTKRESEGKPYTGPDLSDLPPDAMVLYQIAIGLDYIHSRNLVHRDIKPDNVLISSTKPVHLKLSDFGFCKKVSPQGTFSQSGLKGTLNWMAPEMLEILNADPDNAPEDLPRGTTESDTFSAGCVFFFFLTRGSHPFGNPTFVPANICNNNSVTLRNTEKNLEISDHLGQSLYQLIGKMVKKKDERISLAEVIQLLTAIVQANRHFKAIERSFPQLSGWCESRFHPTEPVLACGSTDSSSVMILKGANGSIPFSNWRIPLEFKGQTQSLITTLEWNANGTQLAAGGMGGTVIVWSYPSGRVIFEEKKHSREVDLIAWNPFRTDVFATGTRNTYAMELLFWKSRENGDAEMVNHFLTLQRQEWIRSIAWISANQIAIGLQYGGIEICEIDDDKGISRVVRQFERERGITRLVWNERTKYLASSRYDKWIKIWSMDSDQPVHTLEVHSGCQSLAWRPNLITENDGGIDVVRKNKENFIIASGLKDGSIVVLNPLEEEETKRKRILHQKHSKRVDSLSFSPDGRFLSSADWYELIVWSTETSLPVFTCQNYGSGQSWMSMDSSSVPSNKLAVTSQVKICVIEQFFAE